MAQLIVQIVYFRIWYIEDKLCRGDATLINYCVKMVTTIKFSSHLMAYTLYELGVTFIYTKFSGRLRLSVVLVQHFNCFEIYVLFYCIDPGNIYNNAIIQLLT